MRQMPNEIAHDPADDQAGYQLKASYTMEEDARVLAWSRFRLPVEAFEHLDNL
jgi:hypothetical protein